MQHQELCEQYLDVHRHVQRLFRLGFVLHFRVVAGAGVQLLVKCASQWSVDDSLDRILVLTDGSDNAVQQLRLGWKAPSYRVARNV